jgi:hypothetical protein
VGAIEVVLRLLTTLDEATGCVQGLKPTNVLDVIGTTKVVPFHKASAWARHKTFFTGLFVKLWARLTLCSDSFGQRREISSYCVDRKQTGVVEKTTGVGGSGDGTQIVEAGI